MQKALPTVQNLKTCWRDDYLSSWLKASNITWDRYSRFLFCDQINFLSLILLTTPSSDRTVPSQSQSLIWLATEKLDFSDSSCGRWWPFLAQCWVGSKTMDCVLGQRITDIYWWNYIFNILSISIARSLVFGWIIKNISRAKD